MTSNSISSRGSGAGGLPFGLLAYAGAAVSIGICFAQSIALWLVPLLGLSMVEFDLNPHLQAVLMWLFALVAVLGLAVDNRRCGSFVPLILGIASFVIIVGTLYTIYRTEVLMMGYSLLVISAFLNQSLRLKELNEQVKRRPVGALELAGVSDPVQAYNVLEVSGEGGKGSAHAATS